jgi:chlorobactene glucosyltransferase
MLDLPIAFHLFIVAGLAWGGVTVALNLASFEGLRPVPPPDPSEAPLVSVLVPARNESLNIAPCLRSLAAQDYPNLQIIVLDDHSEDDTAAQARALGFSPENERRRLVEGAALPPGWTGKNWACHQLAAQAQGRSLFFTDADTEHQPGTVSALLAYSVARRASLVSAWPRLVTGSWSEKLVIPLVPMLAMVLYPHWLVMWLQKRNLLGRLPKKLRRGLGAANGQCLFFNRESYDAIGGHAAVRSHVVEDVALGREIVLRAGLGFRLFNCEAIEFSSCRMYRAFSQVWEGFSKNLRPVFEDSLAAFLGVGSVQFLLYVLPWGLVFFADTTRPWVLAEMTMVLGIRGVLAARFRTSWLGVALHPLGYLLAIAIGLNSWRLSVTRGVTWKGRVYPQCGPN